MAEAVRGHMLRHRQILHTDSKRIKMTSEYGKLKFPPLALSSLSIAFTTTATRATGPCDGATYFGVRQAAKERLASKVRWRRL